MYTYKVFLNKILFIEDNKPNFPEIKDEQFLIIKSENQFNQYDIIEEVNLQFPEERIFEKGAILNKRIYVEPSKFFPEGFRNEMIMFNNKFVVTFPDQTEFDLYIQMDLKEEEIIQLACKTYKNNYRLRIVESLKEKINSENSWMLPPSIDLKLSATFSSSQYDDLKPLETRTIWSQSMYSSIYRFHRDAEGFVFSVFILDKSTPATQNNQVAVYRLSTDIKGRFDENNHLQKYDYDNMFYDDQEISNLQKQLSETNSDNFPKLPNLSIILPPL